MVSSFSDLQIDPPTTSRMTLPVAGSSHRRTSAQPAPSVHSHYTTPSYYESLGHPQNPMPEFPSAAPATRYYSTSEYSTQPSLPQEIQEAVGGSKKQRYIRTGNDSWDYESLHPSESSSKTPLFSPNYFIRLQTR